MRYLLTTAALALLLTGTSALAMADPALTNAQASATTATAPAGQPARSDGPTSSQETGTPIDSPDVMQWTAQLIQEQRVGAHHTAVAHGLGKFASRLLKRTSTIAKSLTRDALRFLGTPYFFGGTSTTGFDCSGYVQHVFAMLGMSIPRTADAQYYAGNKIRGGMKPGDLVFFQTYESGPSHVGIYLGHGHFVHASSSHGVMVSSLSDSYWSVRYLGAKRLIARR